MSGHCRASILTLNGSSQKNSPYGFRIVTAAFFYNFGPCKQHVVPEKSISLIEWDEALFRLVQ
jgi:hypothetical protein